MYYMHPPPHTHTHTHTPPPPPPPPHGTPIVGMVLEDNLLTAELVSAGVGSEYRM